MSFTVGGSTPQLTFADATVQNTAALPLTGGSVSADITVNGLTVGRGAGAVSTNTAVGASALAANTTGSNNTAVGYQAGYSNTTGTGSVYLGQVAGYSNATGCNTFIGTGSGYNTTGTGNTFVGSGVFGSVYSSGYYVTTGNKNTILGNFTGNQGGLDIHTASNYIVLSDGDGNPRQVIDSSGNIYVGTTSNPNSAKIAIGPTASNGISIESNSTSVVMTQILFRNPNGIVGGITTNGSLTTYSVSSDYRLKENLTQLTGAKEFILSLKPKQGNWKVDGSKFVGFVAHEFAEISPTSVIGEKDAVDKEGNPVYQTMQSATAEVMANLISLVQEQQAMITTLQTQVTALQTKVGV